MEKIIRPLTPAQREVLDRLSEPGTVLARTEDGWNYWPDPARYAVAHTTVVNLIKRGAIAPLDEEEETRYREKLAHELYSAVQRVRDNLDAGCYLVAAQACMTAHRLAKLRKAETYCLSLTGKQLLKEQGT